MRSADWVLLNLMRAALDRTQRMIGFAFCFGFGLLLSLMVGCCARSVAACPAEAGLALLLRAALGFKQPQWLLPHVPACCTPTPRSAPFLRLPAGPHVSVPVIHVAAARGSEGGCSVGCPCHDMAAKCGWLHEGTRVLYMSCD